MGLYSERIFPALCDRAMRAPEIQERRRRMLAPVSGNVLEIGFGTGLSAKFYPGAVTKLTALEPSGGMSARAAARVKKAPIPIEMIGLAGENLPFDDAQFDHVTCSLTLCSVTDPARVLSEIHRVLKPGGGFHFIEHVRADTPRAARWQDRLNGLQTVIGDGCHLNRDTRSLIRQSGLTLGDVPLEAEPAMPLHKLFPIAQGMARKPGS